MGLAILMFLVGVGVVMGGYALAVRLPAALEARRLNQRLADLSAPIGVENTESLVKRAASGPLPALDKMFADSKSRVRPVEAHRSERRQHHAQRGHRHEPGRGPGRRAGDQHPGARAVPADCGARRGRRRAHVVS